MSYLAAASHALGRNHSLDQRIAWLRRQWEAFADSIDAPRAEGKHPSIRVFMKLGAVRGRQRFAEWLDMRR